MNPPLFDKRVANETLPVDPGLSAAISEFMISPIDEPILITDHPWPNARSPRTLHWTLLGMTWLGMVCISEDRWTKVINSPVVEIS